MFGKRSFDRKNTDPSVIWNMFQVHQRGKHQISKKSLDDRIKDALAHEPRIDTVLPQPKSRTQFYASIQSGHRHTTNRVKRERKA